MLLTVKGMGFVLCDFDGRGSIVPKIEGLVDVEMQFACACLSIRATDRRQSGMQAGRFRHRSVTLDNTQLYTNRVWFRALGMEQEPSACQRQTNRT